MNTVQPYILMLEDDSDDRHITSSFFSESGREIPIEFLERADEVFPYLEKCGERNLPKVIILDRNVPGGDSMQVLRQLKDHAAFRVIPVIMVSGSAFPADITESYRLGVNSFIAKPFHSEATSKTINTFISYWFDVVELPGNVPATATFSQP